MPVNVSKALEIATKTAKSLLAVSYQGPTDKPKVFARYKAQANGALLAFEEEMTVQSTGWEQAEKDRAETLSKQCKLQLILASIDSSILQLWPNDIAECETAARLLQFLSKKLDDKTPPWEKQEKYIAELKAIRRRPGERYVDFFDRLNTAASRVYVTDEEYRKSYVKMEFYLQLGPPAKQFVRVHTDGAQEDPATFAVTLDNKGLYVDDPAVSVAQVSLETHGSAPPTAPDTRKDDIATLQAQMNQVLNILSEKQGTSQHVNAVRGAPHLASDPPRPSRTQKKTCWACGKEGHIARSCCSVPPCHACGQRHRERRVSCEKALSRSGNGPAQ